MAAPTEYRSTDASAPVISGQSGTLLNALTAILVDGYGSKPAAGWSKPYTSGTDYASLRQGSGHQRYLAVNDSDAQMCRVIGYETMSDAVSGTGPFPTSAQISGGGYVRKSTTADSTARPWICWATDRTVYLCIWCGQSAPSDLASLPTASGDVRHFGFGQTVRSKVPSDAYNTFIIATNASSPTDTTQSATAAQILNNLASGAQAGHYMPRNRTQTGTSVQVRKADARWEQQLTRSGSGESAFLTSSGALRLDQMMAFDGSNDARRGWYPGLWAIMNAAEGNWPQLCEISGRGGTLNGRSFRLLYTGNGGVAINLDDWEEA